VKQLPDCIPRLDQLPMFQVQIQNMRPQKDNLLELRPLEQARFIHEYSLEMNWLF
jgi:hypothetical protein